MAAAEIIRRVLLWAGALVVGAALGVASAWGAISASPAFAARMHEGWRYQAPRLTEDGYGRASRTLQNPMGLSPREELLFTLNEDENGRPFDEACVYVLSGGALPARWWAVALYGPGGRLPPNNDYALGFDADRAEADGVTWSVRISPIRGDAPRWISSREARRFSLSLRLYQPRQAARESPESIALPHIETHSCPDGVS